MGGHVFVSFDVTGNDIADKARKCRTLSNDLRTAFCSLFGLDAKSIELVKPAFISNGLSVKMIIYGKDDNLKKIDFDKILGEAKKSGKIAEIMKNGWKLSGAPLIGHINVKMTESKQ